MKPISTVMMAGRGDVDFLLETFATQMIARGYRVRGIVQVNTERRPDHACDMDVKVLPDGAVYRISQSLGAGARGCRLDPEALEMSVVEVEASLRDGADLVILNKFGKQEAEGRGFRDVLASAVAEGIPVLVGLNALNKDAFDDFAAGLAAECAPTLEALTHWAENAIRDRLRDAA
ncbi:DUF2478 domain-containing protein [Shimia sp. FJ5]|uniref:DUF2478 domain-containing protein n=1 Tax=Shimia sp. FJ5 TaxID=3079054 RepID=UPI002624D9EB|nr:DUF2478 domain-containing protein [Shimia sp. FJ5]MDV4145863.1 DUF2478 domain-containing protein [Shimia sp. FJ5]